MYLLLKLGYAVWMCKCLWVAWNTPFVTTDANPKIWEACTRIHRAPRNKRIKFKQNVISLSAKYGETSKEQVMAKKIQWYKSETEVFLSWGLSNLNNLPLLLLIWSHRKWILWTCWVYGPCCVTFPPNWTISFCREKAVLKDAGSTWNSHGWGRLENYKIHRASP